MIGTSVSHYRILEQIGSGGMGVVYKAEDTRLGRTVALKFLPPELTRNEIARKRFMREAHTAAKLDHPNICTVYDVGEADDEQVWIAMACYDGETLKDVIAKRSLTVEEAIRIGRQLADGLAKAHASGMVHRDIKPENVMITAEGVAKILDFGLARSIDATTLTSPNAMAGTVAYMSPEQLKGGEVSQESDVWSLGVVLYEMLTGTHPHKGEYMQSVAYSIINEEHVPVEQLCPDLPKGIAEIVERMLEKAPSKRFIDAGDVVAAIDDFSGDGSGSGAHALTRPRLNYRRRRQLARAGIFGLLIAIAVVIGVQLDDSGPEPVVVQNVLPDNIVLGVLPFQDISEELAPQIGRGFANAMSAQLSDLPGLQIVSSVRLDAEAEESFRTDEDLCRARGANLLLHGTLQKSGDLVRATWILLDLEGRQMEGSVAEAPASALLSLQDTVTRQLLAALSHPASLTPVPITKDEAFSEERFLEAMGYLTRYDDVGSIDAAIDILDGLGDAPRVQAALGSASYRKFLLSGRDPEWAERALEASKKALATDPEDPDAHRTMGEIYTHTAKYEHAEYWLRRALELRPDDADARQAYAGLLEKQGRMEEAEEEFKRAILVRPTNWAGHNKLGSFYLNQNRFEDALAAFGKAERLAPDNTYVISNIGVAYYLMGRYHDALSEWERCNRVRPTGPTYNNIGTLLYYLGRYDDAADAFDRATALSPDDFQVWAGLADSLRWSESGKGRANAAYRKAIELAEVDLMLNPRDANTLAMVATCHAKVGNTSKAISTAMLAVETAPHQADINYFAGVAMEIAGNRESAIELIRHALELGYTRDELMRDPELEALVNETDVLSERKEGV